MASKNRKPYEGVSEITQAVLDDSQDNLLNGLQAIIDLEAPDGSILRLSDRNIYVGEHFYQALTNFPTVNRTVGDWLGNALVFSEVSLELSNADGRFNNYLPGGADFGTWVGNEVILKIGLGENPSTYKVVFRGYVSNEKGFSRSVKSIVIKARNDFEKVNQEFPNRVYTESVYPVGGSDLWGTPAPIIYGDWTDAVSKGAASLPTVITNGANIELINEPVSVSIERQESNYTVFSAFDHGVYGNCYFKSEGTLPSPLDSTTQYQVPTEHSTYSSNTFIVRDQSGNDIKVVGGWPTEGVSVISASQGYAENGGDPANYPPDPVRLAVCDPVYGMEYFDRRKVYLLRSSNWYNVPESAIGGYTGQTMNNFNISQTSGWMIDDEEYKYKSGDQFFFQGKGVTVDQFSGSFGDGDTNAVNIAKHILINFGNLTEDDFDDTWDTFAVKPRVAQTKVRAYIDKPQKAMEYAISLLEQVALEAFVNRDLKFSLNSLYFDDWNANPTYRIDNWDIERGSFKPGIDDRNNFNRGRGVFNFLPDQSANSYSTSYFKNQAAIDQQGNEETKVILYPNLYIKEDVDYFFQETLKLTSSFREVVATNLTARAFLLDIGDFVKLNVNIGSSNYTDVPCMIREIGYDPRSLRIVVKLWALTMIPFPGWEPNYPGTVGGYNATIGESTF